MPRAVPQPIRELIVQRHQAGESLHAIAQDLERPFYTVRKLWRRFRDRGEIGLVPDYAPCSHATPHTSPLIVRAAVWLKRRHPGWGAGLIRVLLQRKWPQVPVPSERTLQRWFQRAFPPPPPESPPPKNPWRATQPHVRWQVDAKERIVLEDGTQACWLSLADEGSGAVLDTVVFPPGQLAAGADGGRAGSIPPGVCEVGAAGADPER
jgi:hypothetical protein